MNKIFVILFILFLILSTAIIKNSTKRIDDEIFTVQENIRNFKKDFENISLEHDYLSSAEKLLEFQNLYFDNELVKKDIKEIGKIDKDLNTGFAEAKIAASKNLSGQSAIDAAASVASENFKGNLLTKTQLTDVMEAAKGSGEISEQDIIISATNEVIKGKNLPDGDYTVGDVLVTITEGQVTNIKR